MHDLSVYIPRLLRDCAANQSPDSLCYHDGAVLLTDLVGFTATTHRIVAAGMEGAEDLHRSLQDYFCRTIEAIEHRGGDVAFFAGDSVAATWVTDGDPVASLHSAVSCGLELLQSGVRAKLADHREMDTRLSVGVGSVSCGALGGNGGQWLPIIGGDAVNDALGADSIRMQGAVVAGKQAMRRAPLSGLARPHASGCGLLGPAEGRRLRAPSAALHDRRRSQAPADSSITPRLVPEIVIRSAQTGQMDFPSEFRQASVVFLHVAARLLEGGPALQAVVRVVQGSAGEHGGWFYQIRHEGDRLLFIVVFGAPTFSHADDAVRGVSLAESVRRALFERQTPVRAGVASGVMFCGEFGTDNRRTYLLLGGFINQAARLAQAARWGECLCDELTAGMARRAFHSTPTTSVRALKGLGSISVHAFGAIVAQRADTYGDRRPVRGPLIEALLTQVQQRAGGSQTRVLLIQAQAGYGKSTILRALAQAAEANHLPTTLAEGQRGEAHTVLSVGRLFVNWAQEVVAEAPAGFAEEQRELTKLLERIAGGPSDRGDDTNRGNLAVTDRVGQLIGSWLDRVVSGPFLWIVDDIHQVDSASWRLLVKAILNAPRGVIVTAGRPEHGVPESLPGQAVECIALPPLDNAEVTRVLCNCLQADRISGDLLDFVATRAGGNPLFVAELASSLLAAGAVALQQRHAQAVADLVPERCPRLLPASLVGLITSRFDRLRRSARELAKTASVLGDRFDLTLLDEVARAASLETDRNALAQLSDEGWITRKGADALFSHALYREAIYNLMPYKTRRALHRCAADVLERSADPALLGARAAHLSKAGELDRALPLLEHAAENALLSQANREAVELYKAALDIRGERGGADIDCELARSLRLLGRGLLGLTKTRDACQYLERSIESAGFAVGERYHLFARELLEYVLRRFRRALGWTSKTTQPLHQREAMHAAVDLASAEAWLGRSLRYAHLSFFLANLADRVNPTRESAWGFASIAYLLSLTPARRFSESEFRRAMEIAARTGDPEIEASCGTLYGMALYGSGEATRAVRILAQISSLADGLHANLWRHRARFMYAESLLEAGENQLAARVFDEAAELARDVEPGVYGFTRCMAAIALARLGHKDAALSRIEGGQGVDHARSHGATLPLFASLGAELQVRIMAQDDLDRVSAIGQELEAMLGDWRETAGYFAGLQGHVGMAELAVLRRRREGSGAEDGLRNALANLKRFSIMYPAAGTRHALYLALFQRLRGEDRAAFRSLARAEELARGRGQTHELNRAAALAAAWGG